MADTTAAATTPAKEQLNAVLADLIQKVTQGADAVVEFGQEQIPLVVQELIRWQIAYHSMWVLLMVAYFLVVWRTWVRVARFIKEENGGDWDHSILLLPGSMSILGIFAVFTFFDSIFDLLKWTLAPRIALLEYAAQLVK